MPALFSTPAARVRFLQQCKEALTRADETLMEKLASVGKGSAPCGGPFAAQLALVGEDGSIAPLDPPCVNEVIKSGVPSRHAEHEALNPVSYARLVDKLTALKNAGKTGIVILFSSGQSCITCHTKQEIIARDLIRRGLLARGQFLSLFGASYDETQQIAGFDDKKYAQALIERAEEPRLPLIPLAETPAAVQRLLREAAKPLAVIAQDERIYATGTESRSEYDLFATAEIMALRNACLKCRQEGAAESWKIGGTLYTTNRELGPLLYAEAVWTNVDDIVFVEMPPELEARQYETRETPGLSNGDFLGVIAGGYAHPTRAVHVFRDFSFPNRAQPFWAGLVKKGRAPLYNGAEVEAEDLKMRILTEERFTAPDFSAFFSLASHA